MGEGGVEDDSQECSSVDGGSLPGDQEAIWGHGKFQIPVSQR